MKLATANLGNGSAREVRDDLLHLMGLTRVICTQESHDRHDEIASACNAMGWSWYFGTGSGHNVVLWDEDLPAHRFECLELSGRTPTGNPPGPRDTAGPDVVAKKELVLVRFQSYGWVGSAHMPASQWWPPRRRLAKANAEAMADFVLPRWHVAIGADWNTKPNRRVLQPLRRAGMTHSQDLHRINTGHGPIDGFMFKGFDFPLVRTIKTSSDHDAVIVELNRSDR